MTDTCAFWPTTSALCLEVVTNQKEDRLRQTKTLNRFNKHNEQIKRKTAGSDIATFRPLLKVNNAITYKWISKGKLPEAGDPLGIWASPEI